MQINNLLKELEPYAATLVAVTKMHEPQEIMPLYEAGLRQFGENRVQELLAKKPLLPDDIQWHMIGHLQTNKVRQVLPEVVLIQSVASEKLYNHIAHECEKRDIHTEILFELQIAAEETKTGWEMGEFLAWIDNFTPSPHITVRGLMGMATLTGDKEQISAEFTQLRMLFDQLSKAGFAGQQEFDTLSMGMSSDYRIALDCGSNMVRIGSLLFH